jgi:hypothetical protein
MKLDVLQKIQLLELLQEIRNQNLVVIQKHKLVQVAGVEA